MIRFHRRTRLLYALLVGASLWLIPPLRAEDRVLIFAPEIASLLGDAAHHARAAQRLAERLAQGGINAEQIVRLQGKQATAANFRTALSEAVDETPPDGRLVVVLCAPGWEFDDNEFICAADTPADIAAELAKPDPQIISLEAVVREMAQSASRRRVLIVDPIVAVTEPLADGNARFGRRPLPAPDGQWIVINRSGRMNGRDGQPPITDFFCSVLDGLAVHADGNRDGAVSLLELVEYLKLYAEDRRDPEPRIAGKLDEDFPLIATSADSDRTFPREELQENARRLIVEAEKALLFDVDIEAALNLLDRAARLCRDEDLKAMIADVFASARILNGEAAQVLPRKAEAEKQWTAVLPRGSGLREGGTAKVTKSLPAGTIVDLFFQADKSVWVTSASLPLWSSEGLSLQQLEIEPGWIELADLKANPSSQVPNEYLRQRLAQLLAADQ
jgi:hypothetical protein